MEFLEDLGPVWFAGACVIILISYVLKTWLVIGVVIGVVSTLYIHPIEANTQHARHAFLPDKDHRSKVLNTEKYDLSTSPKIAEAIPGKLREQLEIFSSKLIRDYVQWWYQPPSFPADEAFPKQCQASLIYSLNALCQSFRRKDVVLYFDALFMCAIVTLGVVLEDLQKAYKMRTDQDRLGLLKFTMLYPNKSLSRMLDPEERKNNLDRRAAEVLASYCHPQDMGCAAAATFLRKLLSVTVFEAAISSIAGKDFLNRMIVMTLRAKLDAEMSVQDPILTAKSALDDAAQEIGESALLDSAIETDMPASISDTNSGLSKQGSTTGPAADPAATIRGRRLSFKNKSISSVAEFGRTDEGGGFDTEKKPSFLKRTSSLLSKSRSRSTSPSKFSDQASEGRGATHGRSRSISPFKRVTKLDLLQAGQTTPEESRSTLYCAELIVSDTSDIPVAQFSSPVSSNAMPKFSILISPTKQEGFGLSGGIGVFRSIMDLENLHKQMLTLETSPFEKPNRMCDIHFPKWKDLSYSDLEAEVSVYLTMITRDKALAEHPAFRHFCRSDVVMRDHYEEHQTEHHTPSDNGRSNLNSVKRGAEHILTPTPVLGTKDPLKKTLPETRDSMGDGSFNKSHENTRVIFEGSEASTFKSPTRSAPSANSQSGVDLKRIDFQNLVSQSMELLTAIYSLSPRTWTIRKQLLNLLRNLLLSKNSSYATGFLQWLDATIFVPLTDANVIARRLREFNDFMFPIQDTPTVPLSESESAALAAEARQLFTQNGIPSAIRNLMGSGPTTEALSILFDALQDPEFSRGLVAILFSESLKTLLVD